MKRLLLILVLMGLAPMALADPDEATGNVAEGNPAWVNRVQGEDAPLRPAWDNRVRGEGAQVNPAWDNRPADEEAQGNPAWVNEASENVSPPNVDMWQNY